MVVQERKESYDTMQVSTTSPVESTINCPGFRKRVFARRPQRADARSFLRSFTNRCTPCPQCSASIRDREELAGVPRVAELLTSRKFILHSIGTARTCQAIYPNGWHQLTLHYTISARQLGDVNGVRRNEACHYPNSDLDIRRRNGRRAPGMCIQCCASN
jgi:hypothetical protein